MVGTGGKPGGGGIFSRLPTLERVKQLAECHDTFYAHYDI